MTSGPIKNVFLLWSLQIPIALLTTELVMLVSFPLPYPSVSGRLSLPTGSERIHIDTKQGLQ